MAAVAKAAAVLAADAGGTVEAKEEDRSGDTKKTRKGLFSFGGDKKEKERAQSEEKEAQEAREKAAREEEKKKEEEAEEELRIEREEESARLEQKHERQQELLKQVVDPSTRVFQLNMKARSPSHPPSLPL